MGTALDSEMDKRVLITGGTGFIGSHLANQLAAQGYRVDIIARSHQGDWRLDSAFEFNVHYFDLKDQEKLRAYILKCPPQIIFNLYSMVNAERNFEYIPEMIQNNLLGTVNLISALQETNYELLVHAGTCEEYGDGAVPFLESQRELPVSPYSFSKVAATYFCQMIKNVYKKPIVVVRPFLTYGPKQINQMLIPSFIRSLILDEQISVTRGEQTRDFIYIDDLVNLLLAIAQNRKPFLNYDIINLGTGNEYKIKDVMQLIKVQLDKVNKEFPIKEYRPKETMHFYPSIEIIKRELDWKPSVSLEEGIKRTIHWWLENKSVWEHIKNGKDS